MIRRSPKFNLHTFWSLKIGQIKFGSPLDKVRCPFLRNMKTKRHYRPYLISLLFLLFVWSISQFQWPSSSTRPLFSWLAFEEAANGQLLVLSGTQLGGITCKVQNEITNALLCCLCLYQCYQLYVHLTYSVSNIVFPLQKMDFQYLSFNQNSKGTSCGR